jgi:hypothetical protein
VAQRYMDTVQLFLALGGTSPRAPRLRVVADPDPSAIALVADRFRNLNILRRRLLAQFGTDDRLHIEVDVCGMTKEQLSLIANKIAQ